MRKFFTFCISFVFFFTLLSCVLLAVIVHNISEDTPLVSQPPSASSSDISRLKQLLPKIQPEYSNTEPEIIELSERDINLGLNYLHKKHTPNLKVSMQLTDSNILLDGTYLLPIRLSNPYINFQLSLTKQDNQITLSSINIGRRILSIETTQLITSLAKKHLKKSTTFNQISSGVHKYRIEEKRLTVWYAWDEKAVSKLKKRGQKILFPTQNQHLIQFYLDEISSLSATYKKGYRVSVSEFLSSLFRTAQQRTLDINSDPITENKALLIAAGYYSAEGKLKKFLPTEPPLKVTKEKILLTFHRRKDLGKHFLVSAAIATATDKSFADTVSTHKEIKDTQRSSGFSPTDLAASLAGSHFAELSTRSKDSAARVQNFMAGPIQEADIFPNIDDLPEGLSADEYQKNYASQEQDKALKRHIEFLIFTAPVYNIN